MKEKLQLKGGISKASSEITKLNEICKFWKGLFTQALLGSAKYV
jgi:hypothetical protein